MNDKTFRNPLLNTQPAWIFYSLIRWPVLDVDLSVIPYWLSSGTILAVFWLNTERMLANSGWMTLNSGQILGDFPS